MKELEEIERLKEQLSTKEMYNTIYWEAIENCYKENKQLKEQLATLNEALKLACGKKGDIFFKCPCICEIGDFNKCYHCKCKYFIEQAKKSINKE